MMHTLVDYTVPEGKVLVLRTCHADMSSSRDFRWPEAGGMAKAPDWSEEAVCGNGLHGWLWGVGDVAGCGAEYGFTEEGARWLVLEVDASTVVDLGAKVKFPSALVLLVSDVKTCSGFISKHTPILGQPIIAGTATAGDGGTATAGYRGTATAGNMGTATAGNRGTATAGNDGTATAGDRGTATAGDMGTATAGAEGTIMIRKYDEKRGVYRWVIGEVGEVGIEANVPYVLDAFGKLVKK